MSELNHASINDYHKVVQMVKRCLSLLKNSDYEMNITTKDIHQAIEKLSVVDTPKGRSCAGTFGILINVGSWWGKQGHFPEYASFAKDPVIGSLRSVTPDLALLALVAHEVAHYVQFRIAPNAPRAKVRFSDYRKPHGNTFKHIYRHLRRDLVNKELLNV